MGGRLDGHLVQGHVDTVAECIEAVETGGSWRFSFQYAPNPHHLLVDKGSVCLNGVSLTVVLPQENTFSVAIIPYTWEHTNFKTLHKGDSVNIEFDVIGKYIGRYMEVWQNKLMVRATTTQSPASAQISAQFSVPAFHPLQNG